MSETALRSSFVEQPVTAKTTEAAITDILIIIPKIDGLKVAAIIREDKANIPIIIISAHDEDYQLKRAKELKVSTYLRKPFTLQQLKDAMTKALKEK